MGGAEWSCLTDESGVFPVAVLRFGAPEGVACVFCGGVGRGFAASRVWGSCVWVADEVVPSTAGGDGGDEGDEEAEGVDWEGASSVFFFLSGTARSGCPANDSVVSCPSSSKSGVVCLLPAMGLFYRYRHACDAHLLFLIGLSFLDIPLHLVVCASDAGFGTALYCWCHDYS